MGHARALSKLKDVDRIKKIAVKIIENKLTVRDIEALVKKEKKKNQINRQPTNPDLLNGLNKTRDLINHEFALVHPAKTLSDKLIVRFESVDELERFRKRLEETGIRS